MRRTKNFINRLVSPTLSALIASYLMFNFFLTPSYSEESFLSSVAREELAFGFDSYESPEVIKHQLRAHKRQWRVVENTTLVLDEAGQSINFLVLSIDKFKCLGISGSLFLRFFNDQLSSVAFYPDDYNQVIHRLSRRLAVDLNAAPKVKLTRHLEVENTKDEFGSPYILWKFLPLNNQELSLLRKYYSRKRMNISKI